MALLLASGDFKSLVRSWTGFFIGDAVASRKQRKLAKQRIAVARQYDGLTRFAGDVALSPQETIKAWQRRKRRQWNGNENRKGQDNGPVIPIDPKKYQRAQRVDYGEAIAARIKDYQSLGRGSHYVQIYALRDPRDLTVWYVGKTNNPNARLWEHDNLGLQPQVKAWVRELRSVGLDGPNMKVLESVKWNEWQAAERKWIKFFRESNPQLLNKTEGGDQSF